MRAGRLRHTVTIEVPVRTPGDYAERIKTFNKFGDRSANVEGRGGRETQRANQTVPEADYRVTLRADELTRTLTTDHRFLWNGKPLGIVHVDHTRWHIGEVLCLCEGRNE
jgi:head-tail adaptor